MRHAWIGEMVVAVLVAGCGGTDEGLNDAGEDFTESAAASSDDSDSDSDGGDDDDSDGSFGDDAPDEGGDGPATSGPAGDGDEGGADTSDDDDSGPPPTAQCEPFFETTEFDEPGPFAVHRSFEGPNCSIFRPEVLGALGPHPVIIWGNGTGAIPLIYDQLLSHWASHGFVVAAAATPLSGSGLQMTACLNYIEEQASTSGSVFEGVLALDRIGAAGHSQGGGGTLMIGQDPRVITTAPVEPFTAIAFGGYNPLAQWNQNGPMFLISGALDPIAPRIPYQLVVWETANVPVLWGVKEGVTHIVNVIGPMSAFRREITAWMRYQLMCDEEAAALFVDDCTLCDDPRWTVKSTL